MFTAARSVGAKFEDRTGAGPATASPVRSRSRSGAVPETPGPGLPAGAGGVVDLGDVEEPAQDGLLSR